MNIIISNHKQIQEIKREVIVDAINFDITSRKIDVKATVVHFDSDDKSIDNIITPKKVELTAQNRVVWLDNFSGTTGDVYVDASYQEPYTYEETIDTYIPDPAYPNDVPPFIRTILSSQTVTMTGYNTIVSGYTENRVLQIPHQVGDYVETEMIGQSPYQAKEFDFYFNIFSIGNFNSFESLFEYIIPYIIDRADKLNMFD